MTLLRTAAVIFLAVPSSALAQQVEEAAICTDRPTKANAVCTVPVGKWQLETIVAGLTRFEADGERTDVWTVGASVLKLGLTEHSDMQVGFTPYLDVQTNAGASRSRASGIGDVTVRYKHRLTGGGSTLQIAAIPFIKVPTARSGVGNGKVEGGFAVPISVPAGRVMLTFGPELDLLADVDGEGKHVALVNLVNLAVPVAHRFTVVGELWTAANFDPAGTVTLASADAALAYALNSELQLDVGVNLGLNRHSPDTEVYAGMSMRF